MDEDQPRFEVIQEAPPSDVVITGFTQIGLAGLTAVDFLADQFELEPTGHISARGLPTVTPFEDGRPRHHTRLFSRPSVEVSVLTGELFVPVGVAGLLSDAILDWIEDNDVAEFVVLAGVPVPHGPEGHRTYFVATDDYREQRLADSEVPAMGRGFLDGVNGALLERGMTTDLRVGIFVTPVHPPAPDVEAAIRLIETVDGVYDIDVDTAPLDELASEITRYYEQLQERLESQADRSDRSMPEDRMFM